MLRCQQHRLLTLGKNKKFSLARTLDIRTGALHKAGAVRNGAALFCELLALLGSGARLPYSALAPWRACVSAGLLGLLLLGA